MRTKKARKNLIASAAYQIIALICGLITPRLILINFGSTYNGVVSSATQFLNMISILTLGITGATRVALYKTLAADDTLGTSRIMKATKRYMRKVAVYVLGYAGVLCLVYPLIAHNDLTKWQNAAIIAIVSIGTFAQYFFGISNRTLLQADQSSYIIYALDICKTIVNTLCVALLIRLNSSIYTVKLCSAIIFLITPMIVELIVKRKYNLTNRCQPDDTGIRQRGAVAFLSVANMIHDNIDVTLLTLFTDAKIISVYTVYRMVVARINDFTQIFTTGMEAAFGNMWAKGEVENLKRNFRGFEFVIFALTAVIFSCVGLLILPFVRNYTRGVTDVTYVRLDVAVLITVAEALFCLRRPYLTLVQATGSYKETKNGAAIEAIINLLISLGFVGLLGIPGVMIGTIAANGFRTGQYAWFVSRNLLGRSIWDVVKRMLWVVVCVALSVGMILPLKANLFFAVTWKGFLAESCITFMVACLVTGIMSLLCYRKDLLFVASVAKRMLK